MFRGSLWYLPKREISGSKGSLPLTYCQLALRRICANLHCAQQRWGVPVAPQAYRHSRSGQTWGSASLMGVKWYLRDLKFALSRWQVRLHIFSCVYGTGVVFNPEALEQFCRVCKSGLEGWFCMKIEKRVLKRKIRKTPPPKKKKKSRKTGTEHNRWGMIRWNRWVLVSKKLSTRRYLEHWE